MLHAGMPPPALGKNMDSWISKDFLNLHIDCGDEIMKPRSFVMYFKSCVGQRKI